MRRTRTAPAVSIEDLIDGENHVGVLYLDSNGLVVRRSAHARRLLGRERGVRERRGRLTADRPEAAEALERVLQAALSGSGPVAAAVGEPEGVVVHATPVVNGSADACRADEPRIAACVLLVDPREEISVAPETLKSALGLTRAQSEVVAGLVRGMTVRQIAEATGRKSGSVRWHVKRALERTGARRQSDLVRMAMAASWFRLSESELQKDSG